MTTDELLEQLYAEVRAWQELVEAQESVLRGYRLIPRRQDEDPKKILNPGLIRIEQAKEALFQLQTDREDETE